MSALPPSGIIDDDYLRKMQSDAVMIKLDPGEHHVTDNPNHVIVTVLGSCIAACIRDSVAGVGGMNHFMLPASNIGEWAGVSASTRYGNFAMEELINDIFKRGGKRHRLEAKIFGGASMIAGSPIGDSNADFVESYLAAENIRVIARHLRGPHARRVHYTPHTGQAFMRLLRQPTQDLTTHESSYAKTLQSKPISGSIELFD